MIEKSKSFYNGYLGSKSRIEMRQTTIPRRLIAIGVRPQTLKSGG